MLNLDTEQKIFAQGYKYIAGVDEAGRGPLAGPVVAACVIIDQNFRISNEQLELIKDSKKLSAKKRLQLFPLIKKSVTAVEIGLCSHNTIDKINILQASFLAMKRALERLIIKPDFVLVDGKFPIPKLEYEQQAIIDGDAKVFSIAAASIIAKVSRDWLMEEMAKKYPEYLFEKHKGYGTKIHLEKIQEFGPSPIHRLSFEPLKTWFNKKN
ncbi:MAG: ribonuclease HII [Planctomycetes bacterium]|jgi:ribonuclease HII|nr:ribonuclease HII [Planctomycetota bacterium]